MSNDKPRLIPTGNCWCGCGTEVGLGRFFAHGHDKVAEAAFMAVHYDASVPRLLAEHGYGPASPVTLAAVEAGVWEQCDQCTYRGAPASITNHKRKHHTIKEN